MPEFQRRRHTGRAENRLANEIFADSGAEGKLGSARFATPTGDEPGSPDRYRSRRPIPPAKSRARLTDPIERMTNSQRLATVRLCFANWLAQNGAAVPAGASFSAGTAAPPATLPIRPAAELPYFRESILIRKGFYCGRRFDACGFEAVWFFEEDQLKFYDPADELRGVLRGDQIDAMANAEETSDETSDESEHVDPQRRAA